MWRHLEVLEDIFARTCLHRHDWGDRLGERLGERTLDSSWIGCLRYKGHEEVVELLLNSGADSFDTDWEWP
jgi:hypothetical protein